MLLFWDGFDHYKYSLHSYSTATTFLMNKWTQWFTYGGNNTVPGTPGVDIGPGYGRLSTTDNYTGGCQIVPLSGITNNFNAPSFAGIQLQKFLNVNCTTFYCGWAYNWNPISGNGSYTGDSLIARFLDIGFSQFELCQTELGTLYVTVNNGAGVTGSSPYAMEQGVWNYIEVGATIGSAGSVTVRVNGLTTISLTGVAINPSGHNYINEFILGVESRSTTNVGVGTMLIDDVYFNDNTTSYNNNFLGDVRVRASFATMNGTLTGGFSPTASLWVANNPTVQFTVIEDSNGNAQYATAVTSDTKTGGSAPTWATGINATTTDNHVTWTCLGAMALWNMIQENAPDGDSSYIYSNTLNSVVTFKFQSVLGSTVYAVGVCGWMRKDDAGFRSVRPFTLSAGATAIGPTDLPLSNSYTYEIGAFPIDPNTSSPWTLTGANNAEFGFEITV